MEEMDCLVVYVPRTHSDRVRDAMAGAGAGSIGNYSHCSFVTEGTGHFTPQAGAEPFIGTVGQPEAVPEHRIEAVLPRRLRDDVVAAVRSAHPYEEPALMTFGIAI